MKKLFVGATLLLVVAASPFPNTSILTKAATTKPACQSVWQDVSPEIDRTAIHNFGGVTVLANNDVWAVGNTAGPLGSSRDEPGTANNDVTADNPNYYFEMLAEHWNGGSWQIVPMDRINVSGGGMTDIEAISGDDIWAVGLTADPYSSTVQHWDGKQWQLYPNPQPSGSSPQLRAVDASSANDVWAVGHYSVNTGMIGTWQTLIEHWNGQQWQIIPSPNRGLPGVYGTDNLLYGVAAIAPNDVWAVGYTNDSKTAVIETLTMHWDGKRWEIIPSPNIRLGGQFWSVAASGSNDVWAVGHYWQESTNRVQPLTAHWDGSSWQIVDSPQPTAGGSELLAVAAVGPNDFWASGYGFRNGLDSVQNIATSMHWTGSQWEVVETGREDDFLNLRNIDASAPDNVWTVGSYYSNGFGNQPVALRYGCPLATATPTPTVTIPPTPSATGTPTASRTATAAASPISTAVPATPTNTPAATLTSVAPTSTPQLPTATSQPATPTPPLATATLQPATPTSQPATPTACTRTFSDLPANHWAYRYVQALACSGTVGGYPDGSFRPNNNVSRAELAKLLLRGFGLPAATPARPTFSDVPANHWAFREIEGLHQAGVIGGYPDGTFRPNIAVNRAELVKLAVLASALPPVSGPQLYPDVPPGYWAYSYVQTASFYGWVGGYPDGSFGPATNASRAQFSKILYLALQ